MSSTEDDKCLRCGQCCYLVVGGKVSDIPCRFLAFEDDGRTSCKIYKRRLGQWLPNNQFCSFRSFSKFDYEGCPYNTNKKIVKVDVKKV